MIQKRLSLLGGAGLGAGLMYLLDPERGDRRRALARDQVVRLMRVTGDAIEPTARDMANRARGLVAETTSLVGSGEVSDAVLEQRVRSRVGRYVSHPGAIEVSADQGNVILRGPVLTHEVKRLISAVAATKGVKHMENQLDQHDQPGNIPGLQGGSTPPALDREHWPPATRFLAGTAGSGLVAWGARRRGLIGTLTSFLGLGMLARGISNIQLKRLFGIGAGRRAVTVQKTINVAVPVEQVFEFWSNFENFPRFMSHVREVRVLGSGRSHWTVDGPAGMPVSWDAVVTRHVPNKELAWRSEEGAIVGNAGIVHFTPDAKGGTQVNVRLTYNPPAGAIGHAVASFFGSDPKSLMDDDLMRFKSLIEVGKTTAGDETVTREELERQRTGTGGSS